MALIIPTTFLAVDRMTNVIDRIDKGLSKMIGHTDKTSDALNRKLGDVSKKSMQLGAEMTAMGAAITVPLGMATHESMQFGKQIGNIATLMDTEKENVQAMSDSILNLARMPVDLEELTAAMYELRSEGFKGKEALEILAISSKAAVTGLSSVESAAISQATALRVFGDEGLRADEIANIFFKTVSLGRTKLEAINESFGANAAIVHEAGMKFAEFQAATAALTNGGIKASQAQTSLKAAVMSMIRPTSEMQKIFAALGVSTGQQLLKNTGGVVNSMEAIKVTAQKMGINVASAFGEVEGFAAFNLLTGSLAGKFREDYAIMTNGVDELNKKYEEQAKLPWAELKKAQNDVEVLAIAIGQDLAPAISDTVHAITPVIRGVTEFAKKHETLTKIVLISAGVLGTTALVIGTVSLAIGTATKATAIFNGVMYASGFIQGGVAVATGTLNGNLFDMKGYAKGAAAGMKVLNTETLATMGLFAEAALAMMALYSAYRIFNKKSSYNESLDRMKEHATEVGMTSEEVDKMFNIYKYGIGNGTMRIEDAKDPRAIKLREQYGEDEYSGKVKKEANDILSKKDKYQEELSDKEYSHPTQKVEVTVSVPRGFDATAKDENGKPVRVTTSNSYR